MVARDRKFAEGTFSAGSALILTVVLTSMLAIVGILFVMMSRVDKVATSAIAEDRELDLAVETVIAKISQQLVLDVPGVAGQEYYDYPDVNNTWLASLEPKLFDNGTPADPLDDLFMWPHITDLYENNFGMPPYLTNYYDPDDRNNPAQWDSGQPAISDLYLVSPYNVAARVVADHENVDYTIRDTGDWNIFTDLCPVGIRADADGDGVADSRWVIIPDMTSSKGESIYAAVRIVDNEAMLNVNTAAKFEIDPNVIVDANQIDGSSQTQINLAALSLRGNNGTLAEAAETLQTVRCGIEPNDIFLYEKNVVWRYNLPAGAYTPFDISDELELRNRFLVNIPGIDARIEETWDNVFQIGKRTPFDSNLPEWYQRSYHEMLFPNVIYSYRHIGTTYNMDRIIDPDGDKMINVNREKSALRIYDNLLRSIYPNVADPITRWCFAQLAVNMVDFVDEDDVEIPVGTLDVNCVTAFVDPYDPCGIIHYGFEAQPFINEIAWKISPSPGVAPSFFALELYNPFNKDIDLGNFILEFVNRYDPAKQYSITFPIGQVIEANGYFVIVNQAGQFVIYTDPNTATTVRVDPALRFFEDWMSADKSKPPIDRRPDPDKSKPPITEGWGSSYDVSLMRNVFLPVSTMLYVDNQAIEPNLALPGSARAFGRDDRDWRVVYQTLAEDIAYGGSLGRANYIHIPAVSFPVHLYSFFLPNPLLPHAEFITVGDIPRILTLGHGVTRDSTIGRQLMVFELLEATTAVDQEHNVRLDLRNPLYRNVFQYFTVFDPNSDNIDNDADGLIDEYDGSEWKVPGRININTAPWYVIAQLPWMTNEIAQAIVAYRDKLAIPSVDYSGPTGRFNATGIVGIREQPGFASTGELNFVAAGMNNFSIGLYALDTVDLPGFPDLTRDAPGLGDGIVDDFEERDVIFSRISNLVTVRSDVFTAYILVRIGADGPQKRVIAILDRSNVGSPLGKVKIVALHYVPDPR